MFIHHYNVYIYIYSVCLQLLYHFCEFYHTNVGSRHQIKTIHTVPLTSSAWLMIGLRHELSYISFCVIRARAKIFGCPPVVSLSSHDNRETPLSETNVLVRFIETVLLSKILRIQIGIIRDYQIVLPWEKSIWDLIHILLEGSTLLIAKCKPEPVGDPSGITLSCYVRCIFSGCRHFYLNCQPR